MKREAVVLKKKIGKEKLMSLDNELKYFILVYRKKQPDIQMYEENRVIKNKNV